MLWLRWRRWLSLRKVSDQRLRALLSAALPRRRTPLVEVNFLVVDLETTSLEASDGEIASIGWVPVRRGKVLLAEAEHYYVAIHKGVGQSATFHQISDTELAGADKLTEMMAHFFEVAKGHVLVFHYAQLDWSFLNTATRNLYQVPLDVPYIDTMEIEKRHLLRHQETIAAGELRLFACRQRYGLPDYPAHNALTDAIATGELLLAQMAYRGQDVVLGDWL